MQEEQNPGMTEFYCFDPLHHLLHLLKPCRHVVMASDSAGDGHYAFLVERIVFSKTGADVLEEGVEIGERF
jgi:hypothetical protein